MVGMLTATSAVARVKRRKRVAWAKGLATASIVFLARCLSVLAPTLWFQWMGYRTFCLGGGDPNGYYAANSRPWCASWRPFPNVYAFVQDHYWNVGLFRYYSPKQLPNFLLALPALGASVHAARAYVKGADDDATWTRKESLRPFMFQWCVMALTAAAADARPGGDAIPLRQPCGVLVPGEGRRKRGCGDEKDAKVRQHVLRGVRARRRPDVPDLLPVDVTRVSAHSIFD